MGPCERWQDWYFTTCQAGFYFNGKTSPNETRGSEQVMVKRMLCSGVKLFALTFPRAKLDVVLPSIQNIYLSQNMTGTSSVTKAQTSIYSPPHVTSMRTIPLKVCVHVINISWKDVRMHKDTQTHQWGLHWANHRLSVWMMLRCLVPHNYIHNNPEPLESLTAKSCVPLQHIQALFQNTHNWLKCNQLTETIELCFKLSTKSVTWTTVVQTSQSQSWVHLEPGASCWDTSGRGKGGQKSGRGWH